MKIIDFFVGNTTQIYTIPKNLFKLQNLQKPNKAGKYIRTQTKKHHPKPSTSPEAKQNATKTQSKTTTSLQKPNKMLIKNLQKPSKHTYIYIYKLIQAPSFRDLRDILHDTQVYLDLWATQHLARAFMATGSGSYPTEAARLKRRIFIFFRPL